MHYCNIIEEDCANGEGFRTTLFVSGCNFHCKDCFNQEAQNFNYGNQYNEGTEKYILKQIQKSYIRGLSLLGGDPLWQDVEGLKQLEQLVQKVHDLNKTVWIWSGFTWEELQLSKKISPSELERLRWSLVLSCDVFIDGLFDRNKKDLSLAWRGSTNQRIINVNKTKGTFSDGKKGRIIFYME